MASAHREQPWLLEPPIVRAARVTPDQGEAFPASGPKAMPGVVQLQSATPTSLPIGTARVHGLAP
jgi:hypothetical protein